MGSRSRRCSAASRTALTRRRLGFLSFSGISLLQNGLKRVRLLLQFLALDLLFLKEVLVLFPGFKLRLLNGDLVVGLGLDPRDELLPHFVGRWLSPHS